MRLKSILALALALVALAASSAQAATAPIVKASWPTAVTASTATMRAEIDPGGAATTYVFEYVTEAQFRAKGFTESTRIPQTGIGIGTGAVSQRLTGLSPDSGYRFRVVATNFIGITVGKVRSIRTDEVSPVFSLPDGRGWEMVSPVDKNGGEIEGFGANFGGAVIQAAAQGGAITYTSSSSFAGAKGAPGASQYLSRRGGSGWETSNITLPALSGTYPEAPGSGVPYQLFSSGLERGLVSNGRRCRTSASSQCPVENPPLPGSGAPAGFRNYYLRDSATGGYTALLNGADLAGLALGPGDFELAFAGATPDLAHIVLSTCAALTPNATEVPGTEGECDNGEPNLYEETGGTLRLLNLLPSATTGTPGAALAAKGQAISSDGNRVYWTDGTNLYLRESGVTKQVDAAAGGGGSFEGAAADGSVAFFTKAGHLWRYNAAAGTAADVTPGGEVQGVLGASPDGAFVYYSTPAGLFLNRNGTITSIAPQVDPLSSPPATGTARVSADGRRLVFVSSAELTAYDNRNIVTAQPEPEVYLYTAPGTAGAGIVCVSCNPSGERPIGGASLPGASPNGSGPTAPDSYKPRVFSADNKRVYFDSFDALAVQDTNGDRDVYQWEATGTGSCARVAGCTNLISSGRAEGGASFLDASADGSDVFFLTDGSLVPADTGVFDLYDARIGGGFPTSGAAIPCFGDACQPLPAEPQDPKPSTERSRRSGNQVPIEAKALHCKKGFVKKRGRCVKRKQRHHQKKKRHHQKGSHQKGSRR